MKESNVKNLLLVVSVFTFVWQNWPEGSLATAESINLCLEEISASIFGVLSSSPRDLYCDRFLLGSIQHTSNTYLPQRICVHGCADETLVSGLWESETRKFGIKHIVIILVSYWYQKFGIKLIRVAFAPRKDNEADVCRTLEHRQRSNKTFMPMNCCAHSETIFKCPCGCRFEVSFVGRRNAS